MQNSAEKITRVWITGSSVTTCGIGCSARGLEEPQRTSGICDKIAVWQPDVAVSPPSPTAMTNSFQIDKSLTMIEVETMSARGEVRQKKWRFLRGF